MMTKVQMETVVAIFSCLEDCEGGAWIYDSQATLDSRHMDVLRTSASVVDRGGDIGEVFCLGLFIARGFTVTGPWDVEVYADGHWVAGGDGMMEARGDAGDTTGFCPWVAECAFIPELAVVVPAELFAS